MLRSQGSQDENDADLSDATSRNTILLFLGVTSCGHAAYIWISEGKEQ
jgi:hypothetical protein